MNKKVLGAGLAMGLALLAGVLLVRRGPNAADGTRAVTSGASGRSTGEGRAASSERAVASASASQPVGDAGPAPAAPSLEVRGRVVRVGGSGQGAEVRLGAERTLAGAAGAFAFHTRCTEGLFLSARQGRLASPVLALDCSEVTVLERLLRLGAIGSIKGEVRTLDGRAVRGARIEVRWTDLGPALSDAEGRFVFPEVPPDRHGLSVKAAGFVPWTTEGVEVGEGATATVAVLLRPGASVSGRVVDRAGEPVSDAEITVETAAGRSGERSLGKALSGVDGRFTQEDLAPGAVRLVVRKEGWAQLRAFATAPSTDVTLKLSLGGDVEGAVRGAGGQPIEGAEVVLQPNGLNQRETTVTTRADGTFTLHNVVRGRYRAWASARSYTKASKRFEVKDEAFQKLEFDLEVATGTLAGRVVSAGTKRPVPGAEVSCESETVTTDPQGRFAIAGLPAGTLDVAASAAGMLEASVEAESGAKDVEIALAAGLGVSGRLLDDAGVPLGSFFVDDDLTEGADGTFRVFRAAGKGRLKLSDGRTTLSRDFEGAPGALVDLGDVVFPAGIEVVLQVKDPAGRPVPGAEVFVLSTSGRLRKLITSEDATPVGVTDAAGEARLQSNTGQYCFVASHPAWAPSSHEGCPVTVDGPRHVQPLTLVPPAFVHGTITHAGKPSPGAMVVAKEEQLSTTAGADGSYRLGPFEPGNVELTFALPPVAEGSFEGKNVELKPGEDLQLDIGGTGRATLELNLSCKDNRTVVWAIIPGDLTLKELKEKKGMPDLKMGLLEAEGGGARVREEGLAPGPATLIWGVKEAAEPFLMHLALEVGRVTRLDLDCAAPPR